MIAPQACDKTGRHGPHEWPQQGCFSRSIHWCPGVLPRYKIRKDRHPQTPFAERTPWMVLELLPGNPGYDQVARYRTWGLALSEVRYRIYRNSKPSYLNRRK